MKLFFIVCNQIIRDIKKRFKYLFIIIFIYFICASNYIGYDLKGIKATLIQFFGSSGNINTRLFLWLFLQSVIISYNVWILTSELSLMLSNTIIRIKSVHKYLLCLLFRILLNTFVYYGVIIGGNAILLSIWKKNMRKVNTFEKYMNFHLDINFIFLFINLVLSSMILLIFILITGLVMENFSKSFLLIQILQLIFILIGSYPSRFFKLLPLIQGNFSLYNNSFTYAFAFFYQLFSLPVLFFLLLELFIKNLERLNIRGGI